MSSKTTVVALMVAIYLAGMISGAFIGRFAACKNDGRGPRGGFHRHTGDTGASADERRAQMMDRLAKRLNLTEAQRLQVFAILENNKKIIDADRAAFNIKMRKTRDTIDTNIRALLTEEQRTAFTQMAGDRSLRPLFDGRRLFMRPLHEPPPPPQADK